MTSAGTATDCPRRSRATGHSDALLVVQGRLAGRDVVVASFEFEFMGGSMGAVVGERFVRAVDRCVERGMPLICFAASGGARMQEALMSLMQMAKTSSALARLSRQRLPFISVLTDPTMGGVSASLAMLGDVIIAEPNALIGFAGPRVIEQTVRETLPEGFQRAEFLLEHGAVDMIVDRRDMSEQISTLLGSLLGEKSVGAGSETFLGRKPELRPGTPVLAPMPYFPHSSQMTAIDNSSPLGAWLEHISGVHFRAIDMQLDRVETVLARMFPSGHGLRSINVAGTNGKGSSVEMLTCILRQLGLSVGSYTSPHLVHYNERVRVDGIPVPGFRPLRSIWCRGETA